MPVCQRAQCGHPQADGTAPHCSPECAAIDASKAWWEDRRAVAVMGEGAAVVQAAGLPWLDTRAPREAL